ncbi:hypothetical protein M7I_6091 [Glarea lozoyensis 74030]|uniref:Uncharacterized protein n=1 Tax=Glarea lozoyensis (strain ATCC 74030 / MF5533) TaxID=1104152 RepID=H0ETM6_GLAL7|nr:hypothetical protein M7I_6091 [Glarea lozoyensis 74030]
MLVSVWRGSMSLITALRFGMLHGNQDALVATDIFDAQAGDDPTQKASDYVPNLEEFVMEDEQWFLLED